jgi:hypothetical protein
MPGIGAALPATMVVLLTTATLSAGPVPGDPPSTLDFRSEAGSAPEGRRSPTKPARIESKSKSKSKSNSNSNSKSKSKSNSIPPRFWGEKGHFIVAEAAVRGLPTDLPAFFRDAGPQLVYLNPEPDRWRDARSVAMNEAFRYDHYVDLENVPEGALDLPDRFRYLRALYEAGLERPERDAGFLSFHIMELHERLTNGFARWRAAGSADERRWIEARIINDAGTLGHYVADASQPHHTTIHFDGWDRDTPNPRGFTTERGFHSRFESQFVNAHLELADVTPLVPLGARAFDDVRAAVLAYIHESHAQVTPLYELEQRFGFAPGRATPETVAFTAVRLAHGAEMLRSLWYTAWVRSAGSAMPGEGP